MIKKEIKSTCHQAQANGYFWQIVFSDQRGIFATWRFTNIWEAQRTLNELEGQTNVDN